MSDRNHFNGVLPVVAELVRAGAVVRFWTDKVFRSEVEAAGAEFADIFDPIPLESVDDQSRPLPSRFVTFAAVRGEALTDAARQWGASLVLHDGFALVGRLVGEGLGVPWVTILPLYGVRAAQARAQLAKDPRVNLDSRCEAAVEILRHRFGLVDASPHHYIGDPSPCLNIHQQPEEWLTAEERAGLEPVAFFGCLRDDRFPPPREPSSPLRIYASLGTIVWRYWPEEAMAALGAIAAGVRMAGDTHLTIGLGGSGKTSDRLVGPDVTILPFAPQTEILAQSDLFVTHHGMYSTHEAIASGTAMLSLPFFADQLPLSTKAQALGIAIGLGPRSAMEVGKLSPTQVADGIGSFRLQRAAMERRLTEARRWESRVISERPSVAARILSLH